MKDYIECRQCKFYKICSQWSYLPNQNSGTDVHTFCMYPENIRSAPEAARIIFKSSPSIINKNHNCNWFQPKDPHKTFVWDSSEKQNYKDHGVGTFNVNPVGGLDGFYVGEKKLTDAIEESVDLTEVKQDIATLKITVAGHDTQITTLSGRLDEVESDIDDIEGDITTINGQVTVIQGDIVELKKGVITPGSEINGGNSLGTT